MNSKYSYVGAIIIAVIGLILYTIFFDTQKSAMDKFAAGGPVAVKQTTAIPESTITASTTPNYCPEPGSLIKHDVKWTTLNRKWENYTPSMATKILNFIGAQWVGVKIGKIICLYQTNEAVSFPVALEQTSSIMAVEPKSTAWSALVNNRKFCKSASVADCSFYFEAPKDIRNIYKEIEYNPDKNATV